MAEQVTQSKTMSPLCVRGVHVHERKNTISVIIDHTHKSINIQLSLSIIRIHIRQVLESYVTVKTVSHDMIL
jgi:hypothetical protein